MSFAQPSITDFINHELQLIMALFLTKPELYCDHKSTRDKQGYFFAKFQTFASNYYHYDEHSDAFVYFTSTRKELAGEFNACGGGGKISHSAAKQFKSKYKAIESTREKRIDAFAKKYCVAFNQCGQEDPRLFLGVKEIWNKLDSAEELVAKSEWAHVASASYSDDTFATPIPANLDKRLVPFNIRNRAVQKHRNNRMKRLAVVANDLAVDEDSLPIANEQKPVCILTTFVRPDECDDTDWM